MPLVQRTAQADEDLIQIWLYIARDNPKAADDTLGKIEKTALNLAHNPDIGTLRTDIAENFRYFPMDRYLLFYRKIESGIELVRVIHSARDLKNIFKQ